MNRVKASVLAGSTVACLLLGACTDADRSADADDAPTTGATASEGTPTEASPAVVATEAPEGGAAVRLGDTEEAIERVGCTTVNDNWSMSGSRPGGAKVAVTTTGDRQSVISASVVLDDGKLVDMDTNRGQGEASITWDGEWFTVVGSGPYFDLQDPEVDGNEPIDFAVHASCPD